MFESAAWSAGRFEPSDYKAGQPFKANGIDDMAVVFFRRIFLKIRSQNWLVTGKLNYYPGWRFVAASRFECQRGNRWFA